MPELPDVAVFQSHLDAVALGQVVEDVTLDEDDPLSNTSRGSFRALVVGRSFEATRRHGKFLFIKLSDGPEWLAFHFGMSGKFRYFQDEDLEPDHARVVFHFESDAHLAFDCPRKFGYVEPIDRPEHLIQDRELGPDALDLDADRFRDTLNDWRGSIKSALMNQSKLAGVGNTYADEILFQAQIHPRHRARDLPDEALTDLHGTLERVLETAIDCRVDVREMPDDFLLPHRTPGAACPRCDGEIERGKVSGRSTYYCSMHQHDPESTHR